MLIMKCEKSVNLFLLSVFTKIASRIPTRNDLFTDYLIWVLTESTIQMINKHS